MSASPSVSIVMPAYNAADTIIESIESVQRQSLKGWELIIIDDGSRDQTYDIAVNAAQLDSRIRVHKQDNAGPSAARNNGIQLGRAKILAFLDADDLWAEQRLEEMLARFAEAPDIGVLFSRTRFFDTSDNLTGTLTPFVEELCVQALLSENPVCSTSNIICRRETLEDHGTFLSGLNYAEDQEWLVRVALGKRWKICGVDGEWFFYRGRPNSLSSDLEAMHRGWLYLVCIAIAKSPESAPQAARAAFGPFHRYLARSALRMHQPALALRYLARGLAKSPDLLLREPRRTLLTLVGTLLAFIPLPALKERIAK